MTDPQQSQPPKSPRSSPGAGGTEHDPLPFAQRYQRALANPQLRRNLLNFQRSWHISREDAYTAYAQNPERAVGTLDTPPNVHLPQPHGTAEFAALRDRLAAIKDAVIDALPEYLDQFQREAEARGAHVYRAADAAAANRYVLDLCRRHGITHVVKSRTMVSEEIELNGVLEAQGITPVETDLGE